MRLWVGSYRKKGGAGLYPLQRNATDINVGSAEPRIANASFAVWSRRHRLAYFVDEQQQGRISIWRHDRGWRQLHDMPSGGSLPCYLALSPDNRWLACANYGDGAIAIFRLDKKTGVPIEQTASFKPQGRGLDPERQDGPHAHCVIFHEQGDGLYHVDLGLDRVFRHTLRDGAIVRSDVALATPPGSGPRHLLLHPQGLALLVCELSAQLMLLRLEESSFDCLHSVPTVPEATSKDNLGGHLAVGPQGEVFVTNRGHDSLVQFAVRGDSLERLGWQHTGGKSPRHLQLTSGFALVAHEEGGGLTRVPLPGSDGQAEPLAPIPGAVFILAIPDPPLLT